MVTEVGLCCDGSVGSDGRDGRRGSWWWQGYGRAGWLAVEGRVNVPLEWNERTNEMVVVVAYTCDWNRYGKLLRQEYESKLMCGDSGREDGKRSSSGPLTQSYLVSQKPCGIFIFLPSKRETKI